MNISWWNFGVHIRPETEEEADALVLLYNALEKATLGSPYAHLTTGKVEAQKNNDEVGAGE